MNEFVSVIIVTVCRLAVKIKCQETLEPLTPVGVGTAAGGTCYRANVPTFWC